MYAKVFTQIFDSSIADNWKHRVVFEDLLKLADQTGVVDMTPDAIAARTRLPKPMVRAALAFLEKPDPTSRSGECEGRRIVRLNKHRTWGWKIVNYMKYRELKSHADRNAYMREYMREKRPSRAGLAKVNSQLTPVNQSQPSPSASACTSASISGSVRDGGMGEGAAMDLRQRLCEFFKRPVMAIWNYSEESALVLIAKRQGWDAEWDELMSYREKMKPEEVRYFPNSVISVLDKWNQLLDRARSAPAPGTTKTADKNQITENLKAPRL